jgi:transposase, IS5 family
MTRRQQRQLALTQLVLFGAIVNPEELMEPALRRIDELLEDEALVDAVVGALRGRRPQSARRGRPSTPAEVVLRMLALKHLRNWSYERLEWEVTGNLVYRRFCRIEGGKVPDAKTMIRLSQLLEGAVLRSIFERVVQVAIEEKASRGRRMRVDTTVVEAPIHYPTDSGLCEDVVRVIRRAVRHFGELGVRFKFKLRNVSLSVSRRMREIAQALRLRGERARAAMKKPYRRLLTITRRVIKQARCALETARRRAGRTKDERLSKAIARLAAFVPLANQVVKQTKARVLGGVTNSGDKLISVFQPYAQILRRGKIHKPTEFGMLVKVQEAENGVVTDVTLVPGKADAPLLVPSVERHIAVFGRAPGLASTDRGFYSIEGERRIQELGVRRAALPKPGYRSKERIAYEKQRWFKKARAWRAGGEARISRLKHQFGMHRARYQGERGLERTVLWAAIANNLLATATAAR